MADADRTLSLQEVSLENWEDCADLELPPDQEDFVATNLYSLAESKFEPHYLPRAICLGDCVVGFLMYCPETDPPDPELFWLLRFMIAREHQGRGLGKRALQLAIKQMQQRGARRIITMHKPSNAVAEKMYDSAGFVATGELDGWGDVLRELVISSTALGG